MLLDDRLQRIPKEADIRAAAITVIFVVSGDKKEHTPDPAPHGGNLGAEGSKMEGLERLDELRQEVGAVFAAEGGFEDGGAARGGVKGEDGNLVGLRGEEVELIWDGLGGLLLKLLHVLHHFR